MSAHASLISQTENTLSKTSEEGHGTEFQGLAPFFDSLQRLPIQRKLSIGAVDDPCEKEADVMADRVTRMPETSFIQKKCSGCEEEQISRKPEFAFIQKKCAPCEEEQIHRKSVKSYIQKQSDDSQDIASDSVVHSIESTRGGGSSLAGATKSFMESRFNNDFSDVRIHTGDYAVQLSRELNAQAFTVGSDVYFNSGKFSPETTSGRHLLAHELTHTIQQNGSIERKIQKTDFSPWPGQAGTDVSNTYSTSGTITREFVQRTGDPHFSSPMPSLLEYDSSTGVLTSTMEIEFVHAANVSNRLTQAQFDELKTRILEIGNRRLNGWVSIRVGNEQSCTIPQRGGNISVNIVAREGTGASATRVELTRRANRSDGREDAGNITEGTSEWTIWHEMGHIVLGAADEYPEIGRPEERVTERDWSIMSGSHTFARRGRMHARHFSHLAAWMQRKFPGCTFETAENNGPLVISFEPQVFLGGASGRNLALYYSLGLNMGIPLDRLRRIELILGPRINLIGDSSFALLLGVRAGLRWQPSSSTSFQGTVFGEGGGLGFTDLGAGRLGAAPYLEGGVNLGLSLPPFSFGVEGAVGGRTITSPSITGAGAPTTNFQSSYRLGLSLGISW